MFTVFYEEAVFRKGTKIEKNLLDDNEKKNDHMLYNSRHNENTITYFLQKYSSRNFISRKDWNRC